MNESARAAHIIKHGMLPFRMISIDVNFKNLEFCYECIEPLAGSSSFCIVRRCENLSTLLLGDQTADALVPLSDRNDGNNQLAIYGQMVSTDQPLQLRQLLGLVAAQKSIAGILLTIIVYMLLFFLGFIYFFVRRRSKKTRASQPFVQSQLVIFTDEVLGYGSQGTAVFRGVICERTVAVKRIVLPPGNRPEMRLIENEINILQSSDHHPNVIRYFYHEVRDSFMYIALELCACSLLDLFQDSPNAVSLMGSKFPAITLGMVRGLFQGIEHLHTMLRIVHRDIKPSNVLLPPAGDKLLLADFGIGKILAPEGFSSTHAMRTICGTSGWRAPELILLGHGDDKAIKSASAFASDVFSAGLVLFYILTGGMHPFAMGGIVSHDAGSVLDDHQTDPASFDDAAELSDHQVQYEESISTDSEDQMANDDSVAAGDASPCSSRVCLEGPFRHLAPALVEASILQGVHDLGSLDTSQRPFFFSTTEAADIIRRMLQKDPRSRPTMAQVLGHPFFWTAAQKLDFLCDISDCLSADDTEDSRSTREALARSLAAAWRQSIKDYGTGGAPAATSLRMDTMVKPFAQDWLQPLSPAVRKSILEDRRRRYNGSRIADLLRAIRNRRSHFMELDVSQKAELGAPPEDFYSYWAVRFPFLVMMCWSEFFRSGLLDRPRERSLRAYYLPWLGSP